MNDKWKLWHILKLMYQYEHIYRVNILFSVSFSLAEL